ncbi:MAG: GNAT family N-acetyltransferase [Saccharopolyspora sp.]|uniref:GNAT family N-acetyltransferase n=1 Tax=Saccharopolyspora sp. TaxID=33915 RepID=UPI0025F8D5A1|nr:GNAT family N-acetyltransferase [Saccharopolyspora sp.]MBQ6644539.1 GNAT family N-acetyltransferase [Saccharopolyspora sp.]
MSDDVIRSDRLDLTVLTPKLLQLVLRGDAAELQRALGVHVPAGWCSGVPARRRLAQLADDRNEQPWLVRAVVHRDQQEVVGHIGFHAPPRGGRVEIGYEIMPGHQRKGYAIEAARALTGWAHGTGRAMICVACIRPDNTASLALAAALGFHRVGARNDAADGLELIHERTLPVA